MKFKDGTLVGKVTVFVIVLLFVAFTVGVGLQERDLWEFLFFAFITLLLAGVLWRLVQSTHLLTKDSFVVGGVAILTLLLSEILEVNVVLPEMKLFPPDPFWDLKRVYTA